MAAVGSPTADAAGVDGAPRPIATTQRYADYMPAEGEADVVATPSPPVVAIRLQFGGLS